MPTWGVHGTAAEWLAWREAAAARGESINGWVRRALNEQVALEAALARKEASDGRGSR